MMNNIQISIINHIHCDILGVAKEVILEMTEYGQIGLKFVKISIQICQKHKCCFLMNIFGIK